MEEKKLAETLGVKKYIDQVLGLDGEYTVSMNTNLMTDIDTAAMLRNKYCDMDSQLSLACMIAGRYADHLEADLKALMGDLMADAEEKSEAAKERYARTQPEWRTAKKAVIDARWLSNFLDMKKKDTTNKTISLVKQIDQHVTSRKLTPN